MNFVQLCKRAYHRLPRPPSTNYNLKQLAHDPYDMLDAGAVVLDLGSKSAMGRYVFQKGPPQDCTIIAMDIDPAADVDVAGDAYRLPFAAGSIDAVLCVSLLEHVRQPGGVVSEISRVLKEGGLIYVNAPFVFPYHADPDDFYRFSVKGIRVLCAPFTEIQSGFNRGPASTMCHLLIHFLAIALSFNREWLHGLLVDFFQWGLFWIKYLDRWIGRFATAREIHSGSFFLGRKPAAPDSV